MLDSVSIISCYASSNDPNQLSIPSIRCIQMPLEVDPELKQVSISILQWLGIPSIAGFLGLYGAWLAFPPEIVIEGVIDKSKNLSSESKIKIKNIGRLPAYSIKVNATDLCAKIGGVTMKNCAIQSSFPMVGRLAHGESSGISVRPGIGVIGNIQLLEFSYVLILKYHAKLFFLKRESSKKWKVSLNNFADGFSWDIKIL